MRAIKVEDKILSLNHYGIATDTENVIVSQLKLGGVCLLYFVGLLQNQGDRAGSFLHIKFEMSVSNSGG